MLAACKNQTLEWNRSLVTWISGSDAIDVTNYTHHFPQPDWATIRNRLEASQPFRDQVICDCLLELAKKTSLRGWRNMLEMA